MPKKKAVTSRLKAIRPTKRATGRLTDKPVSKTDAIALARYAAGLPLNIRGLEIVIGISRAAIHRLGDEGPPFVRVNRGSRLYYPKDVEQWLQKHKNHTDQIEDSQHGQS